MKTSVFIIARAALLCVALALGLSSCVTEYPVRQDDAYGGEPASMRIFLSLDSRSSFEAGFEDGVGYENFIDINNDNYRIYFFDSENHTFIDSFKTVIHPSISPDNDDIDEGLVFNGWLFPEIGNKFKIVVLANWHNYPVISEGNASDDQGSFLLIKGQTTIEQLTTHVGSQFDALATPDNGGSWLGRDRLMPFYGVRSFDLTQSHPNLLDNEGKVLPGSIIDLKNYAIPLIRAMAKVEVLVDNPYACFEDVEMSRICSKGFAAPYVSGSAWKFDWSDYWTPDGGWDGNYVKGVHPVEDEHEVHSKLQFTKVNDRSVDQDGSVVLEKWVAYMPEYRNSGVGNPTSIRVKLPSSVVGVTGDGQWKELLFTPNGESGDMFDIERNNIYRFKVGMDEVSVDIQPFTGYNVRFEFGLLRDERGDLMVLPIPKRDENGNIVTDGDGNPVMTYPQYFLNFLSDDNENHKIPKECDAEGNKISENDVVLEDGDYYAIVVGEDEAMSNAVIWVKDRTGCHVLSNFGSADDSQECNARLVESFFGNNQSEKFYKDVFGYRRVYHFDNHNSIVIHPENNNMLFCMIENFLQEDQPRKYYEVESWDESSRSGWIINKDAAGNEVGFQKITSDGLLGEAVDLAGNPLTTDD